MPNSRMAVMLRVMACFLSSALAVCSVGGMPPPASESEQTLWKLEHAYWRYVQDDDLPAYLGQWHQDFLGWPLFNSAPVHKDHITDWITSQTSKGLTFQPGEFKPGAIQITGNVAVVCYWMTFKWLTKDGTGEAHTSRITHAWIKHGNDWQIIGGMSAPEPAPARNEQVPNPRL